MIAAERHTVQIKRTFFGVNVNLDNAGSKYLQQITSELKEEKIRWVKPGNFHITLRFIGETSPGIARQVMNSLDQAAKGTTPFSFFIFGIGVFRSVNHPRVLWLGVDDATALNALKEKADIQLENILNLEINTNFSPHLTIGRMKKIGQIDSLKQVISDYRNINFTEVEVRKIIYYESLSFPGGPEYKVLSEHPF